jgi:beta-glucosidase
VTEAGEFEVLVGASSRDIRGKAVFTWQGDADGFGLHIAMSLAQLLATEKGTAVLRAHFGDELLEQLQSEAMIMSMNLKQLAQFEPDKLTPGKLAEINEDLSS